ncbi:MAG TPA: phage portal protein, partial [Levilinea sp.]|nr:phage portal protein [Levilinea sp.]
MGAGHLGSEQESDRERICDEVYVMLPNINLVDLAYLDFENEAEKAREKAILSARAYHEGEQIVFLTERVREFLGLHGKSNPFRMNIVRQVVSAISERLIVASFDTTEQATQTGVKPQAAWAWDVWQHNRMDAKESDVHEDTLVDGEHFLIVDWHNGWPRWTPHPRWTGTDAGGDGFGVRMVYPQNDYNAEPSFAVKQWTESIRKPEGGTENRRRRTLYYPNRIVRLVYREGNWKPYIDEGEEKAIIDWTDSRGEPLGIPVVHFKNKKLRCEAWDAIPLQDATNKALVDLLASADMTAFRIFVALGFIPTTDGKEPKADGSNWLKIAPGQVIGSTKPKDQVDFSAIDGQSPEPLQNLVHQIVMWMAMVTDTPISRFIATKQIASEGTLKQQEEPLAAKVDHRRSIFGNAWEDCMTISRRLANAFGGASLDETVYFSCLWQYRRPMDELQAKKSLGVPIEQLWREAGYSPNQIEVMKQSDEYQAIVAAGQLAFWQAAAAAVDAGIDIEQFLLDQGWAQQRINKMYARLEEQ